MPKFRVEWVRRCEWVVEAPTEEAAESAAEAMSDVDLDFSEEVYVGGGAYLEHAKVDAEVVDGEMLDPTDAVDARRRKAASELLGLDELRCRSCEHCGPAGTFREFDCGGIVYGLECPKCHARFSEQDMACSVLSDYREADMLMRQGELMEVE